MTSKEKMGGRGKKNYDHHSRFHHSIAVAGAGSYGVGARTMHGMTFFTFNNEQQSMISPHGFLMILVLVF